MNTKSKNISVYLKLPNNMLEKVYNIEDYVSDEINKYINEGYIITEINDIDFTNINNKNLKFPKITNRKIENKT